ncbi:MULTISPECIES: ABC transporter permease [Synergistaceae]|jgi:ABC-2 type transport system permease protein|uniref:ABC transporter permease n=1 Tax=Synergistaceae TaxID=649777 RepID=UPI003AEB13EA|nr:ABC transporter permease [Synergistaceae bacterium DZ-S4]
MKYGRKGRVSPRRLTAVIKKEFIHIFRDTRSLAMAFLMPVILLFIFGYGITLDIKSINMGVYDLDKTAESRGLVERFRASGYFDIVGTVESTKETDRLIDRNIAHMVLVVPEGFGGSVKRGEPVDIQAVYDGSDANTTSIAMGYTEAITSRYSQSKGAKDPSGQIDLRLRVWYNPELKSRWFIIPGLIAIIMGVISALLTSLTVSREWEQGTMEQLLSTPIHPVELFLGKITPYFLIGMIDVLISVAVGVWIFGVPLRGSFIFLLVVSSLFLVGGLSLGILISTAAKSQLVASQAAFVLTLLPAFMLSGFLYSIENMPVFIQKITYAVQSRYFVTILKDIFLKGNHPLVLIKEILFLCAFAAIVLTAAIKKFKKNMG